MKFLSSYIGKNMQSVPVLMAKIGFRPSPEQLPVPTPELMENYWFSSSPEIGPRWSTVRDHFNNFFFVFLFKMSPHGLENFIEHPTHLTLLKKTLLLFKLIIIIIPGKKLTISGKKNSSSS